jgi:CRP/FNR family transcriptional regulator, cyclic AMP receptor protein
MAASVPVQKTLEAQLQEAGLQVAGCCEKLSERGPELLMHSALLSDLSPEEVDILGAGMLLVRAAPGQVLIQEGDAGEWMMLLLKGTIDVTKRAVIVRSEAPADAATDAEDAPAEPESSRLAVIRPGAAIGEMSMLDSEPRYASCTAIDEVEAGALGRREIALLIRDHPGVGAKLLVKITQLMAQRLRNTSNQLIKLIQKTSAESAA